jgi:hypothetical protein
MNGKFERPRRSLPCCSNSLLPSGCLKSHCHCFAGAMLIAESVLIPRTVLALIDPSPPQVCNEGRKSTNLALFVLEPLLQPDAIKGATCPRLAVLCSHDTTNYLPKFHRHPSSSWVMRQQNSKPHPHKSSILT